MSISREALKASTKSWESLGPISGGGTVFGIGVSPVPEVTRCWAATGCGIFISDDGGDHWAQNLNGLSTPLLSTLAVAHNGALFAGALSGDLFASFDYGRTWKEGLVPEDDKSTVTCIMPSPNFRNDGTAFAATDGGGLWVTRSSGENWEDSSFGLGDVNVLALASSPDWSRREVMFAATVAGVAISLNGGRAWRETSLSPEDDVVDVLAVSPDFEHDRTVYAGTEAGQLYCSRDGGRTWELLASPIGEGSLNCLWLAPNFAASGRMVGGVGSRIYVSSDRGETWQQVAEFRNSVLTLAGDDQAIFAGLHDVGIWRSRDGGLTWAGASEGLTARGFARLFSVGKQLYALGPQEGLWVSQDKGGIWTLLGGLDIHYPLTAFTVSPSGALFVVGQQSGILRSLDQGQTWQEVASDAGIQAIVLFPDHSGYAGGAAGSMLKTQDGGASWQPIASPCEGQEILSLVSSPDYERDHTIIMGTSIPETVNRQGRVALWRSTNGGETWKQVTTQVTLARWMDIALPVGVVECATEQAVLATGPYCLRPLRRAKDVWISTRVDPGGANALGVVAIGEVDEGGLIYAATGNGVYRSIDGGRTWQPFVEGLDAGSFISIAAMPPQSGDENAVLFALNLGGALWKRELA